LQPISDSNKIYDKYSAKIIEKINELKFKSDVDAERKRNIKASGESDTIHINYKLMLLNIDFLFLSIADDFRRALSGECEIKNLCLKCLKFPTRKQEKHPFFIGSLCKECSV